MDLLGEGRLVSEGAVDELVRREREDGCDPSVTGGTHLANIDCVLRVATAPTKGRMAYHVCPT